MVAQIRAIRIIHIFRPMIGRAHEKNNRSRANVVACSAKEELVDYRGYELTPYTVIQKEEQIELRQ